MDGESPALGSEPEPAGPPSRARSGRPPRVPRRRVSSTGRLIPQDRGRDPTVHTQRGRAAGGARGSRLWTARMRPAKLRYLSGGNCDPRGSEEARQPGHLTALLIRKGPGGLAGQLEPKHPSGGTRSPARKHGRYHHLVDAGERQG